MSDKNNNPKLKKTYTAIEEDDSNVYNENTFPFHQCEKKWIAFEKDNFQYKSEGEKKYILEMFCYPSGQLHCGHIRNFTIGEILTRYYHMKGYKVFRPVGFDSFGLPAENAAKEHNTHPAEWTKKNIQTMVDSFKRLGYKYNNDMDNNLLATSNVNYYKHQQSLFIKLYNKGLIYKKKEYVNWDPVEQTVLANEQVQDGKGWRTGAAIETKLLSQWFLKVSSYSHKLLENLKILNKWPKKILKMQENWIGQSEIMTIKFQIINNCANQFKANIETINVYIQEWKYILYAKFIFVSYEFLQEYFTDIPNKKGQYVCKVKSMYNSDIILPIYITDYNVNPYNLPFTIGVPDQKKEHKIFFEEYCDKTNKP